MTDPIAKAIDVPCDPKTAFSIFADRLETWWPKSHSISAMNGSEPKSVQLEAREGGLVFEIGPDGERHEWGSVLEYQPGERLVLSWEVNQPPEKATRVEVTFKANGDGGTRVDLTHSGWQVHGEQAGEMRDSYNGGWVGVFEESYKAACVAA